LVKIKFFNLIRSKYNIFSLETKEGTLEDVIQEILLKHQQIDQNDLYGAVIFLNNKQIMHKDRMNQIINEDDELVFTHFVGGG
jgi:molybdopterin converting factor small subunit